MQPLAENEEKREIVTAGLFFMLFGGYFCGAWKQC